MAFGATAPKFRAKAKHEIVRPRSQHWPKFQVGHVGHLSPNELTNQVGVDVYLVGMQALRHDRFIMVGLGRG